MNSEKEEIPYPPLLPSKVDLQQVTIIPHAEWERIRDSLGRLTREAAALRAERTAKKKMHVQSQELVKHWTNTYAVSISPLEDHALNTTCGFLVVSCTFFESFDVQTS